MGIIKEYMSKNNVTQYEVATFNGLVPNAIQRQVNTEPDKVTTRTYKLLARVLHKTPEQVFHEVRGMVETQPITLNQLALQVRNYIGNRPGASVKSLSMFDNYAVVNIRYYRDNGKQRTIMVSLRIGNDGLPSIRGLDVGHEFYLYGDRNRSYKCDSAIAEMLDKIIALDNQEHPFYF